MNLTRCLVRYCRQRQHSALQLLRQGYGLIRCHLLAAVVCFLNVHFSTALLCLKYCCLYPPVWSSLVKTRPTCANFSGRTPILPIVYFPGYNHPIQRRPSLPYCWRSYENIRLDFLRPHRCPGRNSAAHRRSFLDSLDTPRASCWATAFLRHMRGQDMR